MGRQAVNVRFVYHWCEETEIRWCYSTIKRILLGDINLVRFTNCKSIHGLVIYYNSGQLRSLLNFSLALSIFMVGLKFEILHLKSLSRMNYDTILFQFPQ